MRTPTFAPPGTNLSPHLEPNRKGRDLVVGDVHGHFATLRRVLAELEVGEHDRVFSLGTWSTAVPIPRRRRTGLPEPTRRSDSTWSFEATTSR